MRRRLVLALAFLVCVAAPSCAAAPPTGKVVELTDNNFDAEVAKGPTFVVVSADWCTCVPTEARRISRFRRHPRTRRASPSLPTLTRTPVTRRHCKALVPTWQSLAKELAGEVAVARVNGPKHKALLKRLRVTAYPTILYLRDGAMREYDGGKRTTAALAAFGRSGYRDASPVPWYRAPNGLAGKLTGAFFRLPANAGALYARAKKRTGASDVTLLLAGLAVPVALGVLAVAAADAYVTRAAKHAGARRRQREAGNHARARERPHRE